MQKREIVSVILLYIFTCGIYGIYWLYVTANELNYEDVSGDPVQNYLVAFLLSIVTCGIYGIYWNYKFYRKADIVTGKDNFLICFIVSLLGLNIVGIAITQSEINTYIEVE